MADIRDDYMEDRASKNLPWEQKITTSPLSPVSGPHPILELNFSLSHGLQSISFDPKVEIGTNETESTSSIIGVGMGQLKRRARSDWSTPCPLLLLLFRISFIFY